jgi:hypothetical protein
MHFITASDEMPDYFQPEIVYTPAAVGNKEDPCINILVGREGFHRPAK